MTDGKPDAFTRRDFIKVCTAAAAAVGLPLSAGEAFAKDIAAGKKPSIVWLHFQECTGCTESLLRTGHPDVGELILDLISLDFHETLFAAAGHQFEECLHKTMTENSGKYILVVEGAIPTKIGGNYCIIAGKTAVETLNEVASKAALTVAIGSCASWGGLPSAKPNPTGAVGVNEILKGKTVVTLPGCPANAYNLLGVVLQFATFGTLPKLDKLGRPLTCYARVIHEDCPRRPHFDAGRFAVTFGDEGHRLGYCLYRLGCKGPVTHANCSLMAFCDVPGAWPIGGGAPCFGCTEKNVAFEVPLYDTVEIEHPTSPATYPAIETTQGKIGPIATGVGGLAVGVLLGAGVLATRKAAAKEAGGKEENKS